MRHGAKWRIIIFNRVTRRAIAAHNPLPFLRLSASRLARGITTLYHLTQPETCLHRIRAILRSPLLLRVASRRVALPRSSWFTHAAFAATKRIHISQSRSQCTHRAVLRSFSIQTSWGHVVECRPTRCRSCRSPLAVQEIYKSPSLHFSDLSLLTELFLLFSSSLFHLAGHLR